MELIKSTVKVSMCAHCPFVTAQGRYYCVRAARNVIVPERAPEWCPLTGQELTIMLDDSNEYIAAQNERWLRQLTRDVTEFMEGWNDEEHT